jgi:hypothetical protein
MVLTLHHTLQKIFGLKAHTHKTRRQPNLKFFCERNKAWECAVKVIGQQSKFFQQQKNEDISKRSTTAGLEPAILRSEV